MFSFLYLFSGMEMSQMTQQMSQMSQMSQSYSQTSSVQQQQSSTSQVYESTQMGGVMKGYKSKTDDELAAERDMTRNSQQFIQDNGIFGGITGDNNSLLQDGQFDSKKHSVKDLVGHFSKVKPRAEIPVQYLPEQRMFNGEQGPSLNYLTTNAESISESQSMMMRSTTSGVDSAASRQQYENRKAEMNGNSQTSTSSFADQSSSVEMRSKTEASTQQKKILTERRQSLSNYLLLDPAASHASAGIIDPSAILRGDHSSNWNQSDTSSSQTSIRSFTASPSSQMYISKPSGPRPFGQTLPRSFKPVSSQAISQPMSSSSPAFVPSSSEPQSLPPVSSKPPPQIVFRPPSVQSVPQSNEIALPPAVVSDPKTECNENASQNLQTSSLSIEKSTIVVDSHSSIPFDSQSSTEISSRPPPTLVVPSLESEYEATVQTSSKHFSSLFSALLDSGFGVSLLISTKLIIHLQAVKPTF